MIMIKFRVRAAAQSESAAQWITVHRLRVSYQVGPRQVLSPRRQTVPLALTRKQAAATVRVKAKPRLRHPPGVRVSAACHCQRALLGRRRGGRGGLPRET